jgi:hypothetical protein
MLIVVVALGFMGSAHALAASDKGTPRTLDGYIDQEHAFYNLLQKSHPLFSVHEKKGRVKG